MSIYGPRIKIPSLRLPDISVSKMPEINIKKLGLLFIIILVIATLIFSFGILSNLGGPIAVYWENNPLKLDETTNFSELTIVLTNTTDSMKTITLDVITNSSELIIFCPEKEFPNVESGNFRQTSCVVRRNPNQKIFTGTYDILINTNIGETITTLSVIK
jgi:hypothetical protein